MPGVSRRRFPLQPRTGRAGGSHVPPGSRKARGNTLSCHRSGRPRLIPPRDQAWVTGTGRSPDFRVVASRRLPGPLRPSGISGRGSAATVAGAVAALPIARLTVFPFDPYVEPIPGATLTTARRACQFRQRWPMVRLRHGSSHGSSLRAGENSATSPLC